MLGELMRSHKALGVMIVVTALIGGCCTHSTAEQPASPIIWLETNHGRGGAKDLMEMLSSRYGTCHSYTDHATILSTEWDGAGKKRVAVFHFDTLFLRGEGLRFRMFSEDGQLVSAIWNRGQRTLTWSMGTVAEESLSEALIGFRGVTMFASQLVPSLLLNLPLRQDSMFAAEPASAGIAPISCGKCSLVTLGPIEGNRQFVFTIAEDTRSLRRFQAIRAVRGAGGTAVSLEHFLSFESEFDLPEARLAHDLEAQPW